MVHNGQQPLNMGPAADIWQHTADAGAGFTDYSRNINLKSKNTDCIQPVTVI